MIDPPTDALSVKAPGLSFPRRLSSNIVFAAQAFAGGAESELGRTTPACRSNRPGVASLLLGPLRALRLS